MKKKSYLGTYLLFFRHWKWRRRSKDVALRAMKLVGDWT